MYGIFSSLLLVAWTGIHQRPLSVALNPRPHLSTSSTNTKDIMETARGAVDESMMFLSAFVIYHRPLYNFRVVVQKGLGYVIRSFIVDLRGGISYCIFPSFST